MIAGTSGRNAISTLGGFNFSEYNTQDHTFSKSKASYTEQDHGQRKYAGLNPLNPPHATKAKPSRYGTNKMYEKREQTLTNPVPGQVPGFATRLPFASADTSLLQWKLKHGLGQNDPSLKHLIDERQIAPNKYKTADWQFQADPYYHSDIGVPSVINQNYLDLPTHNTFPAHYRIRRHGKHDHTNLKEHHTPSFKNDSNMSSGNHHTQGSHLFAGVAGFKMTRGPLERPLMLSDLPQPPTPLPVQ